jgi:hypothetical protein
MKPQKSTHTNYIRRVLLMVPVIGMLLRMGEVMTWTYTKFLTARPIQDTYGTVETPDNAGLVDPSDAAVVGETDGRTLNERAQARTP